MNKKIFIRQPKYHLFFFLFKKKFIWTLVQICAKRAQKKRRTKRGSRFIIRTMKIIKKKAWSEIGQITLY